MAAGDFAHLQPENAEVERSLLAQEVESLRTKCGLRQVDVSKECGVNASMLSQWMLGRYKGNVARINGLMESWLIRRRGGKPMDKSILLLSASSGSPKLKRKLEEINEARNRTKRKTNLVFAQRRLYHYPKMAPRGTYLVPIRLDIDVEGYRFLDSFTWNIYEKDHTFETFAASLVRDLDLPDCFYRRIADSIEAQVEKAKRLLPWSSAVTRESLHPISLNIRLNDTILIDRFEWDLSNSTNDPELFARTMCQDLGLSGEFECQIAISIREQLRDYSRLMREGLRDRVSRLPPVTVALRDPSETSSWEPKIRYVLADDIAQLEREDFKRTRAHSQAILAPATAKPTPTVRPNRPPKPVNTFLMFCRQWRKKIMMENPNINAKDASRILGEKWQKLSDQERASYQPLTDKENARRMLEWQMKQKPQSTATQPGVATATSSSTPVVQIPSAPITAVPTEKESAAEAEENEGEETAAEAETEVDGEGDRENDHGHETEEDAETGSEDMDEHDQDETEG